MQAYHHTQITSLPLISSGKVRDIFAIDDNRLLMVQSDRISVFDKVLASAIAGKGKVLTSMSRKWFAILENICPHHLLDDDISSILNESECAAVAGRAMVVRRLQPLACEAICRGYLVGSGFAEYQKTGKVNSIELPAGLKRACKLDPVLFTPSTKADYGEHDEAIDFATLANLVGQNVAKQVCDATIELYNAACTHALERGIIIADTKFEFAVDADGKLVLIDEVLTPDSSRFWFKFDWQEGVEPAGMDKQFVRDWVRTQGLDHQVLSETVLPQEIIDATYERYQEIERLLLS